MLSPEVGDEFVIFKSKLREELRIIFDIIEISDCINLQELYNLTQ